MWRCLTCHRTYCPPRPPHHQPVSAVQQHDCGGWVYVLDGPDGPLTLSTVATPDGPWLPHPDGRSAFRVVVPGTDWGHAEHRCIPEGQETLL